MSNFNSYEETSNNTSSLSNTRRRSTLSADAEEWYPNEYFLNNNIIEYSDSNFSSPYCTDSLVPTFSMQNDQSNLLTNHNPQNNQNYMEFIKNIIQRLSRNPEDFDDLISDLLKTVAPHILEVDVVSKITSVIFHQALYDPNFQYSAVRLFCILDKKCPLLSDCLYYLCVTELETMASIKNNLLLVAEIFSKLNYVPFGLCLIKSLKKIKANGDNAKTISQTLKIAGGKLEKFDKQLVTELISQLDKLRSSLSPNMSLLVESVIKLRDNQWGEIDETSVEPTCEMCANADIIYCSHNSHFTCNEDAVIADNLIIDETDSVDI